MLRSTYADRPFVQCYNMSSVAPDEFPSAEAVEHFYRTVPSGLQKFPLPEVLRWLDQDIAYVRDAGVKAGAIEHIKAEHGIDAFDMVLIDGSEFTGEVELAKVIGARLILLDDTNTYKCFRARQRLLLDPDYEVIADDQTLRNGFSAFRRRAAGGGAAGAFLHHRAERRALHPLPRGRCSGGCPSAGIGMWSKASPRCATTPPGAPRPAGA